MYDVLQPNDDTDNFGRLLRFNIDHAQTSLP